MLVNVTPKILPATNAQLVQFNVNGLFMLKNWTNGEQAQSMFGDIISNKHKICIGLHESLFSEYFDPGYSAYLDKMDCENIKTKTTSLTSVVNENDKTTIYGKDFEGKIGKCIDETMADILKNEPEEIRKKVHSRCQASMLKNMYDGVSIEIALEVRYRNDHTINDYINALTTRGTFTPKDIYMFSVLSNGILVNFPLLISFGQLAFMASSKLLRQIHDLSVRYSTRYMNATVSSGDGFPASQKTYRDIKNFTYHFLNKFIPWDSDEEIKARSEKYKTKERNEKISVTVGADPELEFYNATMLPSGQVVPDLQNGRIDAHNIIEDGGCNNKLGLDGNTRIAEIRPNPSSDTTQVAKNIKTIIKNLAEILDKKNKSVVFPISGGGFLYSTGGHIHLGHKLLKNIASNKDCVMPLVKMLDDFLYIPFKTYNPYATRGWSKLPEIDKEFHLGDSGRSYDIVPDKIITPNHEIITKLSNKMVDIEDEIYSQYDSPGNVRGQNWGIEYRSMPSFIADYQVTRIVLKIAQKITERYLSKAVNGGTIQYERPPQKEDYIEYITPKEYEIFMSYVNGNRKHIMAENVLKNWRVKFRKNLPMGILIELFDSDLKLRRLNALIEEYKTSRQFTKINNPIIQKRKSKAFLTHMPRMTSSFHNLSYYMTVIDNQYLFTNIFETVALENTMSRWGFCKALLSAYMVRHVTSQTEKLKKNDSVDIYMSLKTGCQCRDCIRDKLNTNRREIRDHLFHSLNFALAGYYIVSKIGIENVDNIKKLFPGISGTLYSLKNLSYADIENGTCITKHLSGNKDIVQQLPAILSI